MRRVGEHIIAHEVEATEEFMVKLIEQADEEIKQYQLAMMLENPEPSTSVIERITMAKLKRAGLRLIKKSIQEEETRGAVVRMINLMELEDTDFFRDGMLKQFAEEHGMTLEEAREARETKFTGSIPGMPDIPGLPGLMDIMGKENYMELTCEECPSFETCPENQKDIVTKVRALYVKAKSLGVTKEDSDELPN